MSANSKAHHLVRKRGPAREGGPPRARPWGWVIERGKTNDGRRRRITRCDGSLSACRTRPAVYAPWASWDPPSPGCPAICPCLSVCSGGRIRSAYPIGVYPGKIADDAPRHWTVRALSVIRAYSTGVESTAHTSSDHADVSRASTSTSAHHGGAFGSASASCTRAASTDRGMEQVRRSLGAYRGQRSSLANPRSARITASVSGSESLIPGTKPDGRATRYVPRDY